MSQLSQFSGDIPGMSVHQFQIILEFWYVCQFDHCLTSLPKLGYLWISPVLEEIYFQIFQRNFLDVSTLVLYNLRFLSETFRRHSWNVFKLIQNEFIVFVCLLICFNFDSVGLSLATCEFLVFSGVNFETSGLVLYSMMNSYLFLTQIFKLYCSQERKIMSL